MKTKKSQRTKKIPIIITVVVIAVLGSGIGLYAMNGLSNRPEDTQTVNPDTQPEQIIDDSPDTNTDNLPDKEKGQQVHVGEDPGTLQPEDTSLEQPVIARASISGDSLKSVATFQKTKSGTCRFEFTAKGAKTVTYQSPIVVGPSYYYCSLSVNISDLSANNNWTLVVRNLATTGSIASQPKEVVIP